VRCLPILAVLLVCAPARAAEPERRLVLVTIDGVRWQEVFRGADPTFAAAAGLPARPAGREEARRALMPFLWGTMARQGQVFGDVDRGGAMAAGNLFRKSYPGYHEMLSGWPSLTIFDNRRVPNPDVTVLEWLNRRPGFAGRVAAFTAWEVFDDILNVKRSGLPVSRGGGAEQPGAETPPWKEAVYDAVPFRGALQHLRDKQPRVLYLALNDSDEWAHLGRYDRYLEAIHRADGWVGELWQALQALPAYRGRTSLIVTTDHGRGEAAGTWQRHGLDAPGSERAWLAVLGPDTAALGERPECPALSLAQVAATLAALVGEDFNAAAARAAPPLPLARTACTKARK
jgi:hypothetical protein